MLNETIMVTQELLDYISTLLQQGFAVEKIKSILLSNQWSPQDVELAVQTAIRQTPDSSMVSTPGVSTPLPQSIKILSILLWIYAILTLLSVLQIIISIEIMSRSFVKSGGMPYEFLSIGAPLSLFPFIYSIFAVMYAYVAIRIRDMTVLSYKQTLVVMVITFIFPILLGIGTAYSMNLLNKPVVQQTIQ